MDPRPGPGDPLGAAEADLAELDDAEPQDLPDIFGRIHSSLAAALAGAAGDTAGRQGPPPPGGPGR